MAFYFAAGGEVDSGDGCDGHWDFVAGESALSILADVSKCNRGGSLA